MALKSSGASAAAVAYSFFGASPNAGYTQLARGLDGRLLAISGVTDAAASPFNGIYEANPSAQELVLEYQ